MKQLFIIAAMVTACVFSGCQEEQTSARPVRIESNPNNVSYQNNPSSDVEKAETILYDCLHDKNSIIRTQAIEIVANVRQKDMMPTVVKLLKDNSIPVKFAAVLAIGDTGYKGGALPVKRLLKDQDQNVRIAAAYTLTKLGKDDLTSAITAQLNNLDQTVRANASLLLGKLGNRENIKKLNWVISDKNSSDIVKIQAIEAIAMLGGEKRKTYQHLWALLISKYADDKIKGIRGMRFLNSVESKNAILAMMEDEMPEIRIFAAGQLAMMSDKSGKSEVLHYFVNLRPKFDNESARQADRLAAMAIGRIGGPELEKYLTKMLNSHSKELRLIAAQSVLLLSK